MSSCVRNGLLSGLAGAVALNALHESARHTLPHAPRVDVIGKRAVVRVAEWAGLQPPRGQSLYVTALASDLLLNSLQYAIVGAARCRGAAVRRGLLAGLLGGLSATALPPVLGLGRQPNQKTPLTQILKMAWYLFGGLVAAEAAVRLNRHAATCRQS